MYESFFGLQKRPFAAAPDPSVLVDVPPVADAVERLDRCVRQGDGVALLAAAAGLGKTQLCRHLAQAWAEDFTVAYLPNAGYPSRRSLLQAVLYELGRPYLRVGEPELRAAAESAARELSQETSGVVLIFDEAHRYPERLLDELRRAANLIESDGPLFRIVLAGQLELEEKLAQPSLAGLNERVGIQISLPRLTAEESLTYLESRTAWAGGELDALFEPDAVDLIVRACGGSPRGLNQLADHGLLLGYVAESRPVAESIVREALEDLKRLPLQWSEPRPALSSWESSETIESEDAGDLESLDGSSAIEVGGPVDGDADGERLWASEAAGVPWNDAAAVVEFGSEPPRSSETATAKPTTAEESVEAIDDRFARLDADRGRFRWELEQARKAKEPGRTAAVSAGGQERPPLRYGVDPLALLDRLEPLVAEALGDEVGTPAGGGRVESLVAALHGISPDAETPGRTATLFSELRRRQASGSR